MLELTQKVDADAISVDGVLCLPFEVRQKSRFRAALDDGSEVGVIVERGEILRDGDVLTGPAGRGIRVQAAPEAVTTVSHAEPRRFAQAAYHLGNRHVPLQIGNGWVRYLTDHVLDDMCRQLGLRVQHESAPFEPEPGAYGQHGHHHD